MNNSMKFFKRLTAFLLALLLVTTMMGDDFSSLADEGTEISSSSDEGGSSSGSSESAPSESTPSESAPAESAPAADSSSPAPAADTSAEAAPASEGEPASDSPAQDPADTIENSDSQNPTTPEDQVVNNDENNSPDENIDEENKEDQNLNEDLNDNANDIEDENLTDEEKKELEQELLEKEEIIEGQEECEHSWIYVSNGDGTHKVKCEKCGEVNRNEDCTFEDHVCIRCGYEDEAEEKECEHEWEYISNEDGTHTVKCKICGEIKDEAEACEFDEDGFCIYCGYEEEVCEHEWEYISNDDGTHTKHCVICGEEEVEDCDFDEDWICKLCGYEDMSLEYQSYSRNWYGVKVTVAGMMPRNSEVTIYYKGVKSVENIVNDNLEEGTFTAFAAYDINIYDRHGDKYQPADDDNTVKVSFENVDEIAETDEEIVVYRIEDDNSITEIDANVSGDDVSFEAEHFTVYVTGDYSEKEYVELEEQNLFAYIETAGTTYSYTKVKEAKFDLYADIKGKYSFTVTAYKNLNSDVPTDGNQIADAVTETITVDTPGWQTVEIAIPETGNSYVAKGNKYSVVVKMESSPNDYVRLGMGKYETKTYIKGITGWERETAYEGILDNVIEETNDTDDSYTVTEINVSSASLASDNAYHFTKDDTTTLTAVLSDSSVERLITWESDDATVAKVESTGNMTATLTAVAAGTTKIYAIYQKGTSKESKYEITVSVIDILIGSDSTVGTTSTHHETYNNGNAITPTIQVKSGTDTYISTSTSSYPYVTSAITNNTNAGTATVTITYKISSTSTYTYTRYFTIDAVDITDSDIFDSASFTISDGKVKAVSNVGTISGGKPDFTKGDFTAEVTGSSMSTAGIKYTITVTGEGNYTGTITGIEKTITDTNIEDLFTVELSSGSSLRNIDYNTTAVTPVTLTPTDNGWKEVTFYDLNGNEIDDNTIITSATADYEIYNYGTTDADNVNAGKKTIVFTMKDGQGFTGSLSVDFTIQQASMTNATIVWPNGRDFSHTGKDIELEAGEDFKVYLNYDTETGTEVEVNTDEYSFTYRGEHVNISDTPKIRVTGAGTNFDSSTYIESEFFIVPNYELDLVIRINDNGTYYDGTSNNGYKTGYTRYYNKSIDTTDTLSISVRLNGPLDASDYTCKIYNYYSYDSETDTETSTELTADVGTKYIVVKGATGTTYEGYDPVVATYDVVERPITSTALTRTISVKDKTFTGLDLKPEIATADADTSYDIKIVYGTYYLKEKVDFNINYFDDTINAGEVSFTIEGMGNYSGSISGSYTINPASLNKDDGTAIAVLAEAYAYVFNGAAKTPDILVYIGSEGNETFSEKYVYNAASLDSDNFSVSYDNNVSPTNAATVTVTGKNNLTGSRTIPFPISTNTGAFSAIYIGNNNNPATKITSDSDTSGTYEYQYTDLVTTYNGEYYRNTIIKVFDSEGKELEKGTDYTWRYYNNLNANTSTEWSQSTSPYLKIKGQGSYAGAIAYVYFNIQPRTITDDMVSDIDSVAWTGGDIDVDPVVTYNGTTLHTGTDYTVKCYNKYVSEDEYENLDTKSGTKYAVITGINNFTGTVVKKFTVGNDISTALVTIVSPYYSAENEDIFVPGSGSLVPTENTSTAEEPFKTTWRNDSAPQIDLYASDGTTKIDPSYYDVSINSSLLGDDPSSYPARSTTDVDDTNYNLITYKVTANGTGEYYGTATIYYAIYPQDIATSSWRMRLSTTTKQEYTGTKIDVYPELVFRYGSSTDNEKIYKLDGGTDFKDYPVNIGTDVGTYTNAVIYGAGNFTGEQALKFEITPGYVNAYLNDVSTVNSLGTTSAATNTFEISDALETYTYTGSEIRPKLLITDKSGNLLIDTSGESKQSFVEGTDYTIEYNNNINASTSTSASVVIEITNSNFVPQSATSQKITVNFNIKTNSIENFTGTLSDIDYTAIAGGYTPAIIKGYIEDENPTATIEVKSANATLNYGEDFEIVTATTKLSYINAQEGYESVTAIQGQNTIPSYGSVNWIFIEGKGAYSGYLQIPFNIVLDLSPSSAYAKVTVAKPSYELNGSGETTVPIAPIIKYRDVGGEAGTYTKTLDSSFILDGQTVYNYTVSRDRDKLPGPDDSIRFTGQYACKNTTTAVRYADGTASGAVVYFLANLANYSKNDISMAGGTVYPYTGSAVTVTFTGDIIDEADAYDETTGDGDYTIIYTRDTNNLTNTSAIAVGQWYAVIMATDDSQYFIKDTNTGATFGFKIKYDLSDAVIEVYDDSVDPITSRTYTGTDFSIKEKAIVRINGTKIYDYASDITQYVTITPEVVNKVRTYTITATAKDTDYVIENSSATLEFKVTGASLSSATFTLEDTEFTYIGSEIEPKVTGKITVGGVTKTLTEGTDFSVNYHNNTNVGDSTAYVGIIGLGSYACDEFTRDNLKFSITKLDLTNDSHVQVIVDDATYSGYYIDPEASKLENVKLTPSYSVYYIDTAKGIRNKLQEQTSSGTSGDWKEAHWEHNTVAADKTDTNAPAVIVEAGDSGNTKGQATGKFTINKLNLNDSSVSIAQKTAQYTGSEIKVYDVVKLTTSYTNADGETITVPLTQQGAYNDKISDSYCDYTITVTKGNTNITNGIITEVGTYSITITGVNSCTSSKTESFTITERSLSDNFRYYYNAVENGFVPDSWDSLYDTTNKRYYVTSATENGLEIYIYDVEEVGSESNPDNKPKIAVVDTGIEDKNTKSGYKELEEGVDYIASYSNNSSAGSAAWNKDGSATSNATVADGSPSITLTGMGLYTDSITLPYNIGKNINTLSDLSIKFTLEDANQTTYTYKAADAETIAWNYNSYNGLAQKPTKQTISITGDGKNLKNYYSLSYTDEDGNSDDSIDAGYKYVVITGTGDYCGTIKQKYAINRKQISADGGPFVKDTMSTDGDELKFELSGAVNPFTTATLKKYVVDTGLLTENEAQAYEGYYFGVYDGEAIQPTITVYDNTLKSTNKVIDVSKELTISYVNDDEVWSFEDTGDMSYATVSFQTSSDDLEKSGGNYYVPESAISYQINYIIISHDISNDFSLRFINETDDNNYNYKSGEAIEPEIEVTNGSRILTQDEDYEVSYGTQTVKVYKDGKIQEESIPGNIVPGKTTLTVKGIGKYSGSIAPMTFYIWGNLSQTDTYYFNSSGKLVAGGGEIPVQEYTGTYITTGYPEVYLALPADNDQIYDVILTYNTEYYVTNHHSDNSYVVDAKVVYSGIKSAYWTGDKTIDYDIEYDPTNIYATNFEEKKGYYWTGYPIEPDFALSVSTAKITNISYDNSTTDVGTVTATIDYSIGSETGTTTATYKINPRPISECTVVLNKSNQRYTGKACEPAFTVFIKSTVLSGDDKGTTQKKQLSEYDSSTKEGDYSVDYGNYIYHDGTGYLTLTGMTTNVVEEGTWSYTIKLQSVANLRVTERTGTSITVKWVSDMFSSGTMLQLQMMDSTGEYKTIRSTSTAGLTGEKEFDELTGSTKYRIIATSFAKSVDGTPEDGYIYGEDKSVDAITDISTSDITVTRISSTRAKIEWTETSAVLSYYIYRSENESDKGKVVAIVPASTGSYTNSKLTSGTTYYYHIDGYNWVDGEWTQVNTSSVEAAEAK